MGKPVVFYIECKKYGYEKKIGVAPVQRQYSVQTDDRINKSILVTTAHFSSDAKKFAEKQNTLVDLMDIDELHVMLQKSAKKYRKQYEKQEIDIDSWCNRR